MRKNIIGNDKFKICLASFLIEALSVVLAMFVFAVLMFLTKMNLEYASVLATASVGIGCFFSSLFAGKGFKKGGIIVGATVGLLTFALIFVISLFIDDGTIGFNSLFHLIIFMLSSLIGGIIGVNKATDKKYI